MPPKKRTIVSSPGASRRSKRNENKASGTTIDSSVNEMAEASELVIRRGVKNATMPAILEDAGSETLVLPPVQIAAAAAAASAAAAAAASAAAAAAAAKPAAVFVAAEHQDYFSFEYTSTAMSRESYLRDCVVGNFNPFARFETRQILPFLGDHTLSPPEDKILSDFLLVNNMTLEDWMKTASVPADRLSDDNLMNLIAYTRMPSGGNTGKKTQTIGQLTNVNKRFIAAYLNMYSFAMALNSTKYMSKLPAQFYLNVDKDDIMRAIKTNQQMLLFYLRHNQPKHQVQILYPKISDLKKDPFKLCQLTREWYGKLKKGVMSHWNHAAEDNPGVWVHHFYLLQNVHEKFCVRSESDLAKIKFFGEGVNWRTFFDLVPVEERRGSILIWKGNTIPENFHPCNYPTEMKWW